jgi:hypothetical protein
MRRHDVARGLTAGVLNSLEPGMHQHVLATRWEEERVFEPARMSASGTKLTNVMASWDVSY